MKSRSLFLSLFLLLASIAASAQGVPFPYSVNLSWTISTSTITGQNVYRAPYTTTCGTFTKLNTTAPLSATATSYNDATVAANSAYCYEVTVIGTSGESGPSNVVSNVEIPPAPDTGLSATPQ